MTVSRTQHAAISELAAVAVLTVDNESIADHVDADDDDDDDDEDDAADVQSVSTTVPLDTSRETSTDGAIVSPPVEAAAATTTTTTTTTTLPGVKARKARASTAEMVRLRAELRTADTDANDDVSVEREMPFVPLVSVCW
jgi:hypothetical protein